MKELAERRTEHATHYVLPDGQHLAEIGHHVNFCRGAEYIPYDLRLVPRGDGLAVKEHLLTIGVSEAGMATNDPSGRGIEWLTPERPKARRGARAATVGDQGLRWRWETRKSGLKLSGLVEQRRGPQDYRFRYRLLGSYQPLVSDINGHLVGDGFHVERPVVVGNDGRVYWAGGWDIIRPGLVGFSFDDSHLPRQALPYTIDPTTTFNILASGNDGYTRGENATYPPGSASTADTTGTSLFASKSVVGESVKFPATAAETDTGQFDDVGWSNETSALAEGGGYASVSLSASPYDDSEYLDLTNFSQVIPTSATIVGIKARVRGYTSNLNGYLWVRLLKAGSGVGTAKTSYLPTSIGDTVFGGSSDLWGTTWNESEIEASGFGVRLRLVGQVSAYPSGYIDAVEVTVYYTGGNFRVDCGHARWDTSSIPDTDTVSAATFRFYLIAKSHADARQLALEWNEPGTITVADWTSTVGTNAHAGTDISALTVSADNDLVLINVAANINKTGFSGLRLHVSGASPGGQNYVQLAAYDHTTLAEPRLLVTYAPTPVATEVPTRVFIGGS